MTLKIYNFFLPFFFIFIIGMLMIPYYFIEEGIKIIFAQALIIAVLEWIVFSSILLAIKITHYILILVLVSFLIPFTNAQLIPETLTIQHILLAFPLISIHPDREFLISRTLMLSYTLILFYLIEYLIYAFLIIAYPSLIFMRKKSEVKHSVPTHVSKLCEKISKELGIRIPRIVFLKTPEIFTFGNDDKNAVITIYERCAELSEDEIEPILIHEMAHIKFDVSHHSFHYLLARFHGKFSILTVLPFLCVAIWFILNFLSILEAPVTSVEQAIHWIIDLIPFMTAF
ncbi:MAG: hypothetical protein QXO75_07820, partial [Nitrososphaerota archaeon]